MTEVHHPGGRKDPFTEAEELLRFHLSRNLAARFDANPCRPTLWYYYGLYDFVLREGRFFTPRPDSPAVLRENAENCFLNSARMAKMCRLDYVEGYASTDARSIPVFHAWNSDEDGFVVDATWGSVGAAYFGVVIPSSIVCTRDGHEESISSVIDDWRQKWPLLQTPWRRTLEA